MHLLSIIEQEIVWHLDRVSREDERWVLRWVIIFAGVGLFALLGLAVGGMVDRSVWLILGASSFILAVGFSLSVRLIEIVAAARLAAGIAAGDDVSSDPLETVGVVALFVAVGCLLAGLCFAVVALV